MGNRRIPTALSIAGSDSGGGAGIQADLKAFARCGVHGMTAITALTAQNTVGVEAVQMVPADMVLDQIAAVGGDIGFDAIKVGMVGQPETVEGIAAAIALSFPDVPVVVDPVMVSESGALLLDERTRETLVIRLLPMATVITPNIPEARVLTGLERAGQEELVRAVFAMTSWEHGPKAVVVTGGHSEDLVDLYFDGDRPVEIRGERHPGAAAHGSGCTHSSALAAFLAHGDSPLAAACKARTVASEAVANGLEDVGSGPGPVDALRVRGRGEDVIAAACAAVRPRTAQ
jgi:hydroxymethylpyrimidine/phosphomethylpyrimidine kinase